ncbi:MAG: hypothetical protein IJG30_05830 [Synergistaceae bacterium]|nr:hypothetical protein [Synergistaceae bacterium]
MTTATAERFTTGNDGDDGWADAPLTPEEEEGLRRGRENARRGDYLTLKEFKEGL